MSNQQGRIKIENAIETLDDISARLGGKFDDSIKDLAMFSDALDSRFGAVAKTSLSGQVEQAGRRVASQGIQPAATEVIADAAVKGVKKMRGINEFNAFESMIDLLNN